MVMIRREPPRTRVAGPARGLSHSANEDSPFRVPLEHCPLRFHVYPCGLQNYAARLFRLALLFVSRSTITPMAQMKPSNSRATAVTTFWWTLPLAANRW